MIDELAEDFYKLTYLHPVSEYVIGQKANVTISAIVRKDSIEPQVAGNYAQSVGRAIPLKIYGKVWQPLDRGLDIWELQITPLAIY